MQRTSKYYFLKVCFHQVFLFFGFPVLVCLSDPLFLSLLFPYLKTLGPTSPNPYLVFLFSCCRFSCLCWFCFCCVALFCLFYCWSVLVFFWVCCFCLLCFCLLCFCYFLFVFFALFVLECFFVFVSCCILGVCFCFVLCVCWSGLGVVFIVFCFGLFCLCLFFICCVCFFLFLMQITVFLAIVMFFGLLKRWISVSSVCFFSRCSFCFCFVLSHNINSCCCFFIVVALVFCHFLNFVYLSKNICQKNWRFRKPQTWKMQKNGHFDKSS